MLLVVRKELPISIHCRSKQKDKELGILEAETAQWSCYNAILEGTSFSSLDCNIMWVRNFDSTYQNRPFVFSLQAHAYTWSFFFLFQCFQFLLSYRISCWGIRFLNVSQHEFIKNWLIIVFLNFTKKGSISETLESWIVVISSDPAGLKEIKPAVKAMYARKVMFETEESLETKSTCNSVQVKLTIQWTLSLNNKVRIEIKV